MPSGEPWRLLLERTSPDYAIDFKTTAAASPSLPATLPRPPVAPKFDRHFLSSKSLPAGAFMTASNSLKAALHRGTPQIGIWLSLNSFAATELAAGAGFDCVLVDMEHSVISEGEAIGHLRAARSTAAVEALVRIPWNDAVMIKRMLDAGARSLLVPYVQNVDEARRAAAATRYPPIGMRGFAGSHRGNDYGRRKDYAHTLDEEIFLAVQVESPEAVGNVAAIAAVEGVDCVFVGPNDLAANMGMLGQANAPEVRAAILSVVAPIKAAGKAAGMLDFNPESGRQWIEAGFDFVAVGSDTSLLSAALAGLRKVHRR
jgi:4-hydroxy-2-oxoheptanedioate aldolase